MKRKLFFTPLLLFLIFVSNGYAEDQEANHFISDKPLCTKMIRFGVQALERKRYLDAKEYFRKALHADTTSEMAWEYYDLAVIFALAEKVNKNHNLIKPDVSMMDKKNKVEMPPPLPQPQYSSAKTGIDSKDEFRIVGDDDGCY
jgi:hypothetical protein